MTLPTTTCPLCGCRTLDPPRHQELFHPNPPTEGGAPDPSEVHP